MASTNRLLCVLLLFSPIAFFTGLFLGHPVLGAVVMGVAILSWIRPEWVLLGLLGVIPLVRSPHSELIPALLIGWIKVGLIFTFGLVWWMKFGLTRRMEKIPGWLIAYLMGWVCLSALSLINGHDITESVVDLALCAAGAILFVVTWNSNKDLQQKMLFMILIAAAGVSIVSVLQYVIFKYRIFPFIWHFVLGRLETDYMHVLASQLEPPVYRVRGTFHASNNLGIYLYMLIPYACAALGVARFVPRQKLFIAATGILMLAGLYATNSRAAAVAVFISTLFIALHRGFRWLMILGVACLVTLGGFYLHDSDAVGNYLKAISRSATGLSSRGMIWENALEMIHRYPWLGVGPANFPSQYYAHFGYFVFDYPAEIYDQVNRVQLEWEGYNQGLDAHNSYLQVVGEYGIFGLPLFLFGVIMVIVKAEERANRMELGSFGRAMALGTAAYCLSYLFACFFDAYGSFSHCGLICLGAPLVAMGLRAI